MDAFESKELGGTLSKTIKHKSSILEQNSNKDGSIKPHSVQPNGDTADPPGEPGIPIGSLNMGAPQQNAYAAPHAMYYGGFDNSGARWDKYSQSLYPEGIEQGSHGTHPLLFHTGYGYIHQVSYGPNGYSHQDYALTGSYYHQSGPTTSAHQTSSIRPEPIMGGGISGNPRIQYYHDTWQTLDGGFWADWLTSPAASPRAIPVGPMGHSLSPFSSPMGSPRWRHYDQGTHRRSSNATVNARVNSYGFVGPRGPVNDPVGLLNEQNRGPRGAEKQRIQSQNQVMTEDSDKTSKVNDVDFGSYNKPDFKTDYGDARFFVIKSYNEDNVHKSIKYGVWSSTSNGNLKLDSAYRESKSKGTECPVFLLFSVNASGHFCGVAEMVGPVDFEKSVDCWQQDKWSGHFPIKWQIIKDVPNSQFRHITLENNDNKPVTNSRDTQEVNLEEGVEMLNIFKDYKSELSILTDFDFYEKREKVMRERKAQQRQQEIGSSQGPSLAISVDQMQRTFAEAVRLDENKSKKEEFSASAATMEAGNAGECLSSLAETSPLKSI